MQVLSLEETQRLLASADETDDRWAALWRLLLDSGAHRIWV
jgi:hypothetical protein